MIQIICQKAATFYRGTQQFCEIPAFVASERKTLSEARADIEKMASEVKLRLLEKFSGFIKLTTPYVTELEFTRASLTQVIIANFKIICHFEIKEKIESELGGLAREYEGKFVKKKHGPL